MATVTRKCEGCGIDFVMASNGSGGKNRRFCKKTCSAKHRYQTDAGNAKEFLRRNSEHGKDYQKKYARAYRNSELGKKYHREYQWLYTKTDKYKQQKKQRRATPEGKLTTQNSWRKRDALRRGAFVENVDITQLAIIQNWVCALCGLDIDKSGQHPDPLSLSIDHKIPLSRGGEHSYKNCAATHLRCNLVKGTKSVNEAVSLLRQIP